MCTIVQFKKITERQTLLFDEYFSEADQIDVIAFDYDGEGTALCRVEGKLTRIAKSKINKIIFGVAKQKLEDYLTSIFDPDIQSEDSPRRFGELQFRIAELQSYNKTDVSNLAKKNLKEFQAMELDTFTYFEEIPDAECCCQGSASTKRTAGMEGAAFYGNPNSQVFHRPTCKSYSSSCTAAFNSVEDAEEQGFRPCSLCKPE